jgi:hypothetical protein
MGLGLVAAVACAANESTPMSVGFDGGSSSGAGGFSGSDGVGGGAGHAGLAGKGGGPNCSTVGCAQPPMCSTGCTEVCGCCPCVEGMTMGNLVCVGGCWDLLVDGGDAGDRGCTYLGKTHPGGVIFAAGDGCNTCTCGEAARGGVPVCTKKACQCNPAAEIRQREYIGKSSAECAAIRFSCPDNTTPFANSCGCGCEQDPSCPDWFDCQPSPGVPPCDTAAIKLKCPYSGIAF